MAKSTNQGFRITGGKGFQITFENGWTVSVQFGYGNYCGERGLDVFPTDIAAYDIEKGRRGDTSAEVAVWGPDSEFVRPDDTWDDDVRGWQSPDDVARLIEWARTQ